MILKGDCIEVMKAIKPNSVDAIVTDPPYGLEFMGKEWDKLKVGRSAKYENKAGFTGTGGGSGRSQDKGDFSWFGSQAQRPNYLQRPAKRCKKCGKQAWSGSPCKCEQPEWEIDNSPLISMQLWHTQWLTEAYRVLKPGGSMLVMGGTRTSHRLACAIEDSGFIIKDTIMFMYGSGFPKAQDLGKMIDKRARRDFVQAAMELGIKPKSNASWKDWTVGEHAPGNKYWEEFKRAIPKKDWERIERKVMGKGKPHISGEGRNNSWNSGYKLDYNITAPSTSLAKHWDGFKVGGIKPAYESIIWATKTLTDIDYFGIMVHKIKELLCNISFQTTVTKGEKTNEAKKIPCGISQHGIEEQVVSSEAMDMLWSEFTKRNMDLNTVSSWKDTLEESLKAGNTYITEMASCTITDLRILNSLLTQNTQEDVIPPKKTPQDGEELSASLVVDILIGVLAKLNAILTSSTIEPAILQDGKQDSHHNLKPNFSPITWAVKPPEGSYVDNVLKWGVGAVNVDETRIGTNEIDVIERNKRDGKSINCPKIYGKRAGAIDFSQHSISKGRFPANVILSHHPECVQVGMKRVKNQGGVPNRDTVKNSKPAFTSKEHTSTIHHFAKDGLEIVESWDCHPDCAVRLLDEQSGVLKSHGGGQSSFGGIFGNRKPAAKTFASSGGASRFFYCAKASRAERNAGLEGMEEKDSRFFRSHGGGGKPIGISEKYPDGSNRPKSNIQKNNHPTVKPIKLFEWLIKLVTREGQIILDPFIGSGTTAIAAHNTGRKCVGIEKEDEYLEIAKRRIDYWQRQPKQMEISI